MYAESSNNGRYDDAPRTEGPYLFLFVFYFCGFASFAKWISPSSPFLFVCRSAGTRSDSQHTVMRRPDQSIWELAR